MAQVPFPVTPPPPLKLKEDRSEEWKTFKQMYVNYAVITELNKKDKQYQRAVFLHTVGPEGLRIFNNLSFESDEDEYDVEIIIKKMSRIIIGETNEIYETFVFNKR